MLSINLGEIPKAWLKYSFISIKKLYPWFDNLLNRIGFFKKWLQK